MFEIYAFFENWTTHEGSQKLQVTFYTFFDLLFRAELKPRGYYLEHVFYLDHVILTNMSHVYYLDQ